MVQINEPNFDPDHVHVHNTYIVDKADITYVDEQVYKLQKEIDNLSGNIGDPYYDYESATVVWDVETTLISYTVPVGKVFSMGGINFGGEADGLFTVYVDGEVFLTFRNSAAVRTNNVIIANNQELQAGSILDIKVKNVNHRKNAALYESTLLGGLKSI